MKRINSDIRISDIVEYGQGYDDAILLRSQRNNGTFNSDQYRNEGEV